MNPRTAYVLKQAKQARRLRLRVPMQTVVETVKAITGVEAPFFACLETFFTWIGEVSHEGRPDLRGWLLARASDEPTLPILSAEVDRFLLKVEYLLAFTKSTALSPEHFDFLDEAGNTWAQTALWHGQFPTHGHPQYQVLIDRKKRQFKSRWKASWFP